MKLKALKVVLAFLLPVFLVNTLYAQHKSLADQQIKIDSLLEIAKGFHYQKEYIQEEAFIQEAIDLRVKYFDKKDTTYTNYLFHLAYSHYNQLDFDAAETTIHEVIDLRTQLLGRHSLQCTEGLGFLASILWRRAKYEEAEKVYKELLTIYEKHYTQNSQKYAQVHRTLGGLYGTMGLLEKAEPHFLKAKEILFKTAGKESAIYAYCLRDLGELYQILGDYEKAHYFFTEAKDIRARVLGTQHKNYGDSFEDLGDLALATGRYQQAETYYKKGLIIYEEAYGIDHIYYAVILEDLGRCLQLLEKFDEAEKVVQQAIDIYQNTFGKDHPAYASSINEMASIYIQTERYDKAEELVLESVALSQKIWGEENPNYIQALFEMGLLYQKTNRIKQAEEAFKKANSICEQHFGQVHQLTATSIQNLAFLYFEAGQKETAISYFESYTNINNKLKKRAVVHLSQQEMHYYLASFNPAQDKLYSFVHDNKAPVLLEQAFNESLLAKGFLLNQDLYMKRLLINAPPSTQEKYHEWKSQAEALAQLYSQPIAQQSGLEALEEAYYQLEKSIIKEIDGYDKRFDAANWKAIQQQLQEDQVVLECIHYQYSNPEQTNEVYYALLIVRKGYKTPQIVPLFLENELENLRAIPRLYGAAGSANNRNLHHLIWQKTAPYLKGVKTIFYAPSGILHRINFSAIPISDKECIGDRFKVYQMGSSRQLLANNTPKTSIWSDAWVFGGIEYDEKEVVINESTETQNNQAGFFNQINNAFRSYRGHSWAFLPWTVKEADDIGELLENNQIKVNLLKGKLATEHAFKAMGTQQASPKIIHLATHGYFFPDTGTLEQKEDLNGFEQSKNPMIRSGIILAGANQSWLGKNTPDGQEDGILTAYEIANMNLSNTALVVLSACDTGLGDIQGDEGVYGLQRAFKTAGVQYILMSLWKVNDAEAYEFMLSFYNALMQDNQNIPDAFRQAQTYMHNKYKGDVRAWAGFVLVE